MITDRGATVVVYGEIINRWVRLPKDKLWAKDELIRSDHRYMHIHRPVPGHL